jgi:hypothetical protein
MPESNFQDVVVLTSASLVFYGEQFVVGSAAGAKSVVFANTGGAQHLYANPTATRSISMPDANGTMGLITALSAGTTRFSNGQLVFSNSPTVSFGINGSTITASAAGGTGGGSMDYVFVMQLVGV